MKLFGTFYSIYLIDAPMYILYLVGTQSFMEVKYNDFYSSGMARQKAN
jgi:hypothetical protein